uniref:Uncharacterized protein n=1 Tax=Lotus japonicus TaxID=34305 RepID=I3S8P5_LOTJA|nr:unknown [Lotus japonicus]
MKRWVILLQKEQKLTTKSDHSFCHFCRTCTMAISLCLIDTYKHWPNTSISGIADTLLKLRGASLTKKKLVV